MSIVLVVLSFMIGLIFNISQQNRKKSITVNLQIDESNLIQESRYTAFSINLFLFLGIFKTGQEKKLESVKSIRKHQKLEETLGVFFFSFFFFFNLNDVFPF